jgi:hypothetical protein
MAFAHRTFVIRQVRERDSDDIVTDLQRLQREGHEIADVRHEGEVWRIYAFDRRFRDASSETAITFRRRATD